MTLRARARPAIRVHRCSIAWEILNPDTGHLGITVSTVPKTELYLIQTNSDSITAGPYHGWQCLRFTIISIEINSLLLVYPWPCQYLSINRSYILSENADKKEQHAEKEKITDQHRGDTRLKGVPEK